MSSAPVTVIILTYNEAANIAAALRSVCGWAEEVFILDSFSTDTTLEIAQRFPCRVVQRKFDSFSGQRNFALRCLPITSEWVFFLDADEWAPDDLKGEISTVLGTHPAENGFYIRRRLYWMGQWLKRGYYPTWLLRLLRRDHARCEDRAVNEHFEVDGKAGKLHCDFIHEDHRGIEHWIDKHLSYARKEAAEALRNTAAPVSLLFWSGQPGRKRWLRNEIWNRLPLFVRPIIYFGYRYFLCGGFIEGKAAFTYHFLQALWFPILIDFYILQGRETTGLQSKGQPANVRH